MNHRDNGHHTKVSGGADLLGIQRRISILWYIGNSTTLSEQGEYNILKNSPLSKLNSEQ